MSAGYTGYLVRDSLDDDGTVPAKGSQYHSPDILVLPPTDTTDKKSLAYDEDPNKPVEKNHTKYRVYVRAKNLGATKLSGYKARIYRNCPSLLTHSREWSQERLKTPSGDSFLEIPSANSQEIVVTTDYFELDISQATNNCLVLAVTDGPELEFPDEIDDMPKFLAARQYVCMRNVKLGYTSDNFHEEYVRYSVSEGHNYQFSISAKGTFPAKTKFNIHCAELGIYDAEKNLSSKMTYATPTVVLVEPYTATKSHNANIRVSFLLPNDAHVEGDMSVNLIQSKVIDAVEQRILRRLGVYNLVAHGN